MRSIWRPFRECLTLGLSFALLGCADGRATGSGEPDPKPDSDAELVLCTDPRPEMCTMDYRPVCGHHCDEPPCGPDERKTYSNGCGACSDAEVVGWIDGPCPEA